LDECCHAELAQEIAEFPEETPQLGWADRSRASLPGGGTSI